MCALVAVSLCLSACSSEASVNIPCRDFYKHHHLRQEVKVDVGDSLTVTLCTHPAAGFQWSELAEISDQSVIEQIDHSYVLPQEEKEGPSAMGAPGAEVWTFKALKEGKSTVFWEYSRPSSKKVTWTFFLTVVVK